ncbi:hypothetical protein [Clostridium fungisolvens]|uniref:Uncharacterized protein n=1 Tax=Clostridium fungisolvens TaxID=1604897 RepID=A0A6V8SFW8_9CLOT|nr:hypothetical protein [Clostridium fungisolvens]GFP75375.1 hypothetical protein bsdtw1_01452 [Clostridium fungisolvens]
MDILKKIKKAQKVLFLAFLILIIAVISYFNSKLVWHTNAKSYIEKSYGKAMTTRVDTEYQYNGKKYKIIFSTSQNKKDELYLQCFEEKFNGLFYKPTYGAAQGNSTSLNGVTCHFIDGSTDDKFLVFYGYNKNLQASNLSVEKTDKAHWITQDISKQEYFLYTYTNVIYPVTIFKDSQDNDITNNFINQDGSYN